MRRRRPPRLSLLAVVCALLALGGVVSLLVRAIGGPDGPMAADRTTESQAQSNPRTSRASRRDHDTPPSTATRRAAGHAHAPALPAAEGAATEAGGPAAVAERFALGWANRVGSSTALRRQRDRLVALSTGLWAREVEAEFSQAIALGGDETGSEGTLVVAEPLRSTARSAEVLVVVRERSLVAGRAVEPYRYATYLARLVAAPGGFAVASWEPQQ